VVLDAVRERRLEHGLHPGAEPGPRPRRGKLDEAVVLVALPERVSRAGDVAEHEVEPEAHHILEGRERGAVMALEPVEQGKCRLDGGDGREGEHGLARPREQFQDRARDDPERAFGADEEVAQAIAGVVLAQPAQQVEHLAVGQHHLKAERE
jgi:hypothetical protein